MTICVVDTQKICFWAETANRSIVASMDEDLETKDRDALIAELKALRAGIRKHRDCSQHDLCWYHPDLWALLPEKIAAAIEVPEWPQFMKGCVRYRQSLDEQCPSMLRVKVDPGGVD